MNERERARERRRARTGLVLIVVIALAGVSVFSLDSALRAFGEGPRVTVLARAAVGVQPGTSVWVAGRPVGRVLSVGFRPPGEGRENVVIHAVLRRGARDVLRADATATLRAAALLEPVVIAIDPGTGTAATWNYADTLRAAGQRLDPEALRLMSDTLLASARRLSEQAAATRERVARADGSLAALARDPAVLATAADDMRRLRRFVAERVPEGTVGRLMADTLVAGRLAAIRDRLARLDSLPGRRRVRSAYAQATEVLDGLHARIAALDRGLDRGEGSAGRLMIDGELARQVSLLRARLDSTVSELVRDPSRWLRVKVF